MPKNPSRSNRRPSPLEKEIAELRAQLPGQQDWRSSDAQELTRRRLRALESPTAIRNLEPGRRTPSRFQIISLESGGNCLGFDFPATSSARMIGACAADTAK